MAYISPLITLFAVIFDDSTQTRYLMGVLRQQDKGANFRARDNNNWTALIWAFSENDPEVVAVIKQFRDRL